VTWRTMTIKSAANIIQKERKGHILLLLLKNDRTGADKRGSADHAALISVSR